MSLLQLSKIKKTYRVDRGVEQIVLKGIDLSFEAGEFVSITKCEEDPHLLGS